MNETKQPDRQITIFTIGFTQKRAPEFFGLLKKAGVKKLVDTRLNNVSQLAGFTKKEDLSYFLKEIAAIDYDHKIDLSPTKDILDDYKKKKITWQDYEQKFNTLMENREIEKSITKEDMDSACLLCSEPTADKCHRRLVVEYLAKKWGHIAIKHL